jgi:hypothetical protein
MSNLLAGDLAHAMSQLTPAAKTLLESIAPASFASGFAATLVVAGCLALAVACMVWMLAGRGRSAEHRQIASL